MAARRGRPCLISEKTTQQCVAPAAKGVAMGFGAFGLDQLPYYYWYEMQHAALGPFRAAADATRLFYQNPGNPLTHTTFGKSMAAGAEMFERVTRRLR